MVVLKRVPLRLGSDFLWSRGIDNDFVSIDLGDESSAVFLAHIVHLALDQVVPLASDSIDELLGVGWITDALEELNALLALQLFQLAVLLDELLLINGQLDALQVVQD